MNVSKQHQAFFKAYGFLKHPNYAIFLDWAKTQTLSLKTLFPTIAKDTLHHINLSTESAFVNSLTDVNNLNAFNAKLQLIKNKQSNAIIAGGYLEKRALYTSDIYNTNPNIPKRNTHIGLDFWLPEHTPVHAILDGEVVVAANDNTPKGYGGLLILKHQLDHFYFYTLYGHNTVKSVLQHKVGSFVKKNECIAFLGDATENGDWVPHLHFQIVLDLLDYKNDFPGVVIETDVDIWKTICPNPNTLFKIPGF